MTVRWVVGPVTKVTAIRDGQVVPVHNRGVARRPVRRTDFQLVAVGVTVGVLAAAVAGCGTVGTGSKPQAGRAGTAVSAGGWIADSDTASFAHAIVTGVLVHAGRCVAVGNVEDKTGEAATSWTAPRNAPGTGASLSPASSGRRCGPWTQQGPAAAPVEIAPRQFPARTARTGVTGLPDGRLVAVGLQSVERDELSSAAAAWTSTDQGLTWTRVTDPALGTVTDLAAAPLPPAPQPVVHQLLMLAVATVPEGVVAVGDDDGAAAVWMSADGAHWTLHRLRDPGPGTSTDRAQAVSSDGGTLIAVGSRTVEDARTTRLGATFPVTWTSTDDGTTWAAHALSGPGDAIGVTRLSGTTTVVGATGTRYTATPGTAQTSIPTVWTRVGTGAWHTTALAGRGEEDTVTATAGRLTVAGCDAVTAHPLARVWTAVGDTGRFDATTIGGGQVLALATDGAGDTIAAGATGAYRTGPGRVWERRS